MQKQIRAAVKEALQAKHQISDGKGAKAKDGGASSDKVAISIMVAPAHVMQDLYSYWIQCDPTKHKIARDYEVFPKVLLAASETGYDSLDYGACEDLCWNHDKAASY